ncbi:EAL domain-containing protein [Methylomonas rhizoryzae]|uniref:EAL domain-containing protein n=1 Tax=Methylomonas rhizoryzae TaxID=2608981 RepID=UPI0012325AA0|nr:EAL domain-containing protein [Methylomonas rhizoryzae]
MLANILQTLTSELEQTLYLNLNEFRLETSDDELLSRYIGLKLRSEFQAIFEIGNPDGLIGYEALLRPSTGIDAVSPGFAFTIADNEGKLVKLDRVARTLHMLNYLTLPDKRGLLFLNVHPKLISSVSAHGKVFETLLHRHSVPTREVVIEVNDGELQTAAGLRDAIDSYKDCGYRIAIDQFGNALSKLDRLWRLSPHFVKFDPCVVKQAERDGKFRRALPKLIEWVEAMGARCVITGIENEIQLDIASNAGAQLLQGYHLARPASASAIGRAAPPARQHAPMSGEPHHFGSFSVAAPSLKSAERKPLRH